MKSGYYVGIFVVIVGIIGGVVLYYATSIRDIADETMEMSTTQKVQNAPATQAQQEVIDVMNDRDIESDAFDAMEEDLDDLENIDGFVEDMTVEF
jgi:hypothetical protein